MPIDVIRNIQHKERWEGECRGNRSGEGEGKSLNKGDRKWQRSEKKIKTNTKKNRKKTKSESNLFPSPRRLQSQLSYLVFHSHKWGWIVEETYLHFGS